MSVNRESLYALRHSFLTLCLDLDSYPLSDAEVAFEGHSGNSGNRWFHSSLQLVVFGNAKACAICNFSTYLDGNTMMRAASELQKRAAACPIGEGAKSDFDSLPAATELKWKFSNATAKCRMLDFHFKLNLCALCSWGLRRNEARIDDGQGSGYSWRMTSLTGPCPRGSQNRWWKRLEGFIPRA
jgi:hypothetical protein